MAIVTKIAQYTGKSCNFKFIEGLPYITIYTKSDKGNCALREVGEDYLILEYKDAKEYIFPITQVVIEIEKG